jgi:hypothetical protein
MSGKVIASAKYRDGHSRYGEKTIPVELIGYASNLTITDSRSDSTMFSIPWGSVEGFSKAIIFKKGLADFASTFASIIPGLDLTRATDQYHEGFDITFSDEEIQRYQRVKFSVSSERKAEKIVRELYRWRDEYFRSMGRSSKPSRR